MAHRVAMVAFDKTGTLTVGQPRLMAFEPAAGEPRRRAARSPPRCKRQRASAGARGRAPQPSERGIAVRAPDAMCAPLPGRGMRRRTSTGGRCVLGQPRAGARNSASQPGALAARARSDCRREGARSPGCVEPRPSAGRVLGLIAFGDAVKPGAREARRRGCARLGMRDGA